MKKRKNAEDWRRPEKGKGHKKTRERQEKTGENGEKTTKDGEKMGQDGKRR